MHTAFCGRNTACEGVKRPKKQMYSHARLVQEAEPKARADWKQATAAVKGNVYKEKMT